MADEIEVNPEALAQRNSGFKFPPRMAFTEDMATTETRLVILGWLRQAQDIISSSGGVAELREIIFRLNDLVIFLSAQQLAAHLKSQKKARGKAHAVTTRTPKKPKKEKEPVTTPRETPNGSAEAVGQ